MSCVRSRHERRLNSPERSMTSVSATMDETEDNYTLAIHANKALEQGDRGQSLNERLPLCSPHRHFCFSRAHEEAEFPQQTSPPGQFAGAVEDTGDCTPRQLRTRLQWMLSSTRSRCLRSRERVQGDIHETLNDRSWCCRACSLKPSQQWRAKQSIPLGL